MPLMNFDYLRLAATRTKLFSLIIFTLLIGFQCSQQEAPIDEYENLPDLPVYSGTIEKDNHIHDARQPWAIGVHSYGIFRAHNQNGSTHDKNGRGYRFNHHPNIVYWNGYYWINYQGGPTDDKEGDTPRVPYWVSYSKSGRNWEAPELLFPSIKFEETNTYMHTRMGFYVSESGRLLAISFHGRHDRPNGGGDWGVARVVREIYGVREDGQVDLGPVYAIRFNQDRSSEKTGLQLYKDSNDPGFVEACDELLSNKLVTQQWFEEDRRPELYTVNLNTPNQGPDASTEENVEAKAFDWYTLPNGRIVGWWKAGAMAYSDDNWNTVNAVNIDYNRLGEHRTAKLWGQRLSNDHYAIIHNLGTQGYNPPTEHSWTRTPMVAIASPNGITYEHDRAVVFGDIAPSRYTNPPQAGGLRDNRDGGPQYVRGISESNTQKPNTKEPTGNIWLTYSVNKEDIWVSEIPVNIRHETDVYPKDDFEVYKKSNRFGDWIIISPAWAQVALGVEEENQFMVLQDRDPYDYAKAMRVFPKSEQATLSFQLRPHQISEGQLQVDITDRQGYVAVRLAVNENGMIGVFDGNEIKEILSYDREKWIDVSISIDVVAGTYSLSFDGTVMLEQAKMFEKTDGVERLEFRTGTYRMDDFSRIGSWADYPQTTLPNADVTVPLAIFDIDNVEVREGY